MNITRHLYLSTAVRAPDDERGAAEVVVEPVLTEVAAADPQAEVAAEVPADPEPAPVAEPPKQTMVPLRVLQQRIGEESNKRQAIETRAREAEARAAEYQAIIERLQQSQQQADPAVDPTRTAAPRAIAPVEQPNLEEAVRRVVDQREAAKSISDVIQRGVQDFTQAAWDEKANILGALGAASPEFVQDVIAVDPVNEHRIIFALAEDPGKAADLASMNVRQRTAELTRMSMAEQAKTPTNQAAPAADKAPPAAK